MAIQKVTKTVGVTVREDGALIINEVDYYVDDVENTQSPNTETRTRIVDVGDDVTAEETLVKDIAQGVHTTARVNARAAKGGVA